MPNQTEKIQMRRRLVMSCLIKSYTVCHFASDFWPTYLQEGVSRFKAVRNHYKQSGVNELTYKINKHKCNKTYYGATKASVRHLILPLPSVTKFSQSYSPNPRPQSHPTPFPPS